MKKLILLLCFIPLSLLACLHYPPEYTSTVTENSQEFFLFSSKESIHLIAKTNLSAEKELPEKLAWIFPLPSVPTKYEEVSPKIFNELYDLTWVQAQGLRGAKSLSDESLLTNSSVKVHAAQVVGRYKVRPLEILDVNPKTASVLDQWLTTNGLKAMPREKQLAYLKKGAVFLVIEAGLKGLKTVDFKPLHIILKNTGDPYSLPVNFTHEGREFDITVYTYKMKLRPVVQKERQLLHLQHSVISHFPDPDAPELSKILGTSKSELQRYSGRYPGHGGMFDDPIFEVTEK